MEAGLDEAGRGPVVGPLVVGLVSASHPATLDGIGIRDSKLLTPARRNELDAAIRRLATCVETVEMPAATLDREMDRHSLNDIEVDLFGELGRRVEATTYYLDACDVDAARFGRRFLARLEKRSPAPRIVSEHKADATYLLVGAASIVAKVQRDAVIARIAKRLEPKVGLPLGSGYPHDEATRAFLARHLDLFGRLPEEARAQWATSRTLIAARAQRRLPAF